MLTGDVQEREDTLLALFERAAATHPSRMALASRSARLSYKELNVAANRLAHALLERGGSPGDRIAVLMQHDLPHIVAVLAVLKAGRVVVALNPTHPAARLRQLIDDAAPAAIVVDRANERLAAEAAGDETRIVHYDDHVDHDARHDPPASLKAEQGVALIYTSGSTGEPKAVIQTHRQVARNVAIHTEAMAYCAMDRIPLFASLSGSQGYTTLFCGLLNGATVCPFPIAVSGLTGLADWMADLGITIYVSSASIFRNFMKTIGAAHQFQHVRAVRLTSEPSTSDDFRLFQQHFPDHSVLVHTLSGTETCTIAWSRWSQSDTVPEGRLPIGRPSRGQEVMLLDEEGQPVRPGEAGEIAIKSRDVAAGYWRNDTLTAERFGADLDGRGTHLVRTGDLGRINDRGLLEFIGRQDDRVKIRGNRIALYEIEAALCRLDGVRQVAVEAIARANEEPLLVAFVAQEPGDGWYPATLRGALRRTLPYHMVPARVLILDALPITPTGKVDRDTLRKSDLLQKTRGSAEKPQTEMERFLAGLWQDAFALLQVGRDDDFFDLGGDSLIAAVMSARIHEAFGLEVELATFFGFPILSELAKEVENLQQAGAWKARAQQPRPRPNQLPLTYNQETCWNVAQSRAQSLTTSRCSRIVGPLDVAALGRCIDGIVERHEMLRTTFAKTGDRLEQIVHPRAQVPLQFYDLAGHADAEVSARQVWKEIQARVFDLAALPLVSFTLIRLRHDEHWLIYAAHAILVDGLSWSVFFDDLAQLYELHAQGKNPALQNDPPQYGDYAVWQRSALHPDSTSYRDQLGWWTNDILTACYPSRPTYRKSMSWCMNALRSAPRPLKQAIGLLLRSALAAPLPPRSELPFKRPAPADAADYSSGMLYWGLPPDVSKRLDGLGRQEGTSQYVTRLAAYVASLAAETGDPNVVVYVALSNRGRPETRNIFGCCATPAILIVHCEGQSTFRQLLSVVRDRLRAMQLHADLPYDRIHHAMRAWKIKMPQGRAVLTSAWTHAPIHCGGIEITSLPDLFMGAAPLAFDVKIDTANEEGNCSVFFDVAHYDPEKVRGFIDHFVTLLDVVSRTPDMRLNDVMAATQGS